MVRPYVITIAGGTASGKTTLAEKLLGQLGERASTLCLDSYYRDQAAIPVSERIKVNYDHPESIEFSLLIQHLIALKAGQAVIVPVYNFSQHTRDLSASIKVESRPVIVVEGILSLWESQIRNLSDLKIFVDAPPNVRFARRLERDVRERGRTAESVTQQWAQTVEPMYQSICAPTLSFADLVSDGTKPIEETLKKILDKIQI